MTAPTTSTAAQAYLAAVEAELADLPVEDRAELLEDLALHLAALEHEPDGRSLEARLGSTTAYAFELRAAAGLPQRQPVRRLPRLGSRLTLLTPLGAAVVREVRAFVPQLVPAWWLLRGYLVVLLPSVWQTNGSHDFPVPEPGGNWVLGVLLVMVSVVASVALGRRRLPLPAKWAVAAVDVAVAVTAVGVLAAAPDRLAVHEIRTVAVDTHVFADSPLVTQHGPVTNVFPYAADGRPLEDVLLFDQDGRPLRVGQQHWWADHCRRVLAQPRAADGVPIPFSYPQRYVLDPEGRQVSGGPVSAGQCLAVLARPRVPIPVLTSAAGTPAPTSR